MKVPHHLSVTKAALRGSLTGREYGLELICAGNEDSDTLAHQTETWACQHFDNAKRGYRSIRDGVVFIAKTMRSITRVMRNPKDEPLAFSLAYFAFGRIAHAIQDFYAHSNYIALEKTQPWNLKQIPNLKTGTFSWDTAELAAAVTYHDPDKKMKESYADICNGTKILKHAEMNLDKPNTWCDQVLKKVKGIPGFARCKRLGGRHALRLWNAYLRICFEDGRMRKKFLAYGRVKPGFFDRYAEVDLSYLFDAVLIGKERSAVDRIFTSTYRRIKWATLPDKISEI